MGHQTEGPCEANPTPNPKPVCDPATTCTGKEKECEGDVCKCKSGFKENPEIAKPDGTDGCVVADAGKKNCIISERFFAFLHLWLFSACDPSTTCVSGSLTTYHDLSVESLYTCFLLLQISNVIFEINMY